MSCVVEERRLLKPMVRPIALLLALSGVVVVSAQTADDVVRETQRLKSQIEQERRLFAADSARQAEWRRQGRERLASMRGEAARLGRERDSLRSWVDRRLHAPPPPPPTAGAAARRKAFASLVASRIDAALPLIAKSGEGAASRADLESLSRSLKAGTGDAAEGLSRLFDAWAEAIDGASHVSARSGTHTTASGRAVRGTFITLGGLLEAFVDNQGDFACLRPQGNAAWNESIEPPVASALRDAAASIGGTGAPGWAWMPAAPAAGVKP